MRAKEYTSAQRDPLTRRSIEQFSSAMQVECKLLVKILMSGKTEIIWNINLAVTRGYSIPGFGAACTSRNWRRPRWYERFGTECKLTLPLAHPLWVRRWHRESMERYWSWLVRLRNDQPPVHWSNKQFKSIHTNLNHSCPANFF